MKGVILLRDEQISAHLDALLPGQSPWLLPVVGKPILEYQLETLSCLGVKEVLLIGAGPSISRKYGQGQSLGLKLEYAPALQTSDWSIALRRNWQFVAGQDLLLIQGLTLTLPEHAPHCLLLFGSQRLAEGICALTEKDLMRLLAKQLENFSELPLGKSLKVHPIYDPASYRQAHFWLAENGSNGISLPAYGEKEGVLLGSQLNLASDLHLTGPGLIADNCRIEHGVRLAQTWLGQGVVVGQGTQIKRSVVLPGSYIGPGLSLENKLVSGQTLIDIPTDLLLEIDDNTWLDQLRPRFHVSVSSRLLAGVVWAVMTPIEKVLQRDWPGLDAQLQTLRDYWRQRLPLALRPKLWQVMTGQMALIGQPLTTPQGSPKPYLDYLPGVIAYSDFLGSEGDQAELDNAFYPLIRNPRKEPQMALQILLRSLTRELNIRQDKQTASLSLIECEK
ncbi:MAG: hypothetical protein AB7I41_10760 [Candidatus Sericytochromatia bacterium]